ncbi:transposase [Bordetella pertussis H918]|nr:transposase [Bordetella pertussis H918]
MADSSLLSAGGQVHVFIGIDVSKAKLDCTLLTAEADKRKTKLVVNTAAGVQALLAWCAKHGAQPAQLHAILEPTGLYHEQAATALPQVRVSLVNPAQARDFAKALALRSKNDALDSYVLARYGQTLSPALWHPAPLHARQLRALLTRREALSKDLLRELNRKEKSQFSPSAPWSMVPSTRPSRSCANRSNKSSGRSISTSTTTPTSSKTASC